MPVKNIECQLAEAQIGRYLSGGAMSPEALAQLEGHIGECALCKGYLSERRAGLQAMLAGRAVVQAYSAVVEMPQDESPKVHWLQRLRRPTPPTEDGPEALEDAPASKALLKPLLLSGALALVLIAMSYVSRNPDALLGEKVIPVAQPVPATPAATPPPVAKAPSAASATLPKVAPKPFAPKPGPIVTVSKPVARKAPMRRRPSASPAHAAPNPAPASPHGSIRVYDSQGNPVTPDKNK